MHPVLSEKLFSDVVSQYLKICSNYISYGDLDGYLVANELMVRCGFRYRSGSYCWNKSGQTPVCRLLAGRS